MHHTRHQVNPLPEISHVVEPVFIAVATPFAANVLEPVVPAPANVNVSVVIAIVTVLIAFTNDTTVPTGNATEPLAGIVNVLAVLSDEGCKIIFPASDNTSVYAADCELDGIPR
jgi:hypothetical protein